MAPLILASRSPVRLRLLAAAGLAAEAVPADVDERALEAGLEGAPGPAEVAGALALAKACEVAARHPGRLVVGADQTLDREGQRFSKAGTREAAEAQLLALQGRRHTLHAAYAVVRDGAVLGAGVRSAHLAMRPLDPPAVRRYLDRAGPEVLGSLGCYHFEGLGMTLFDTVEGDHFAILGLPMLDLLATLRAAGLPEGAAP